MSAAFYVIITGLVVWMVLRSDARREARRARPDHRDAAIDRLSERVRNLEEIITDRDWRLRRDFDGL